MKSLGTTKKCYRFLPRGKPQFLLITMTFYYCYQGQAIVRVASTTVSFSHHRPYLTSNQYYTKQEHVTKNSREWDKEIN